MFQRFHYIIIFLVIFSVSDVKSQKIATDYVPVGGARLAVQVEHNDTLFLAYLKDIWVFPRNTFKNKQQERFYWRMVRDVKITLPFAKLVSSELNQVNMKLVNMKNDKERKKFINQYEKDIFNKYEANLKKLTINQGKILVRLIDRECDKTSFDLIKLYKGSFTAFFWQGIARFFGSNLKAEFNSVAEDKLIERVIVLVEAGQL